MGVYYINPYAFVNPKRNILQMLQALGYSSQIKCALDAVDLATWPGSGQTLTDLTGNNNNFIRGATTGSESSDPSINGTAGELGASNYVAFDGGDYLLESAAHTFAETWHNNNALFTMIFVMRIASLANQFIFDNSDSQTGINLVASSTGAIGVNVWRGGDAIEGFQLTSAYSAGADVLIGLSINEASSAGLMYANGATAVSATASYFNPGTSDASTYAYRIGASAFGSGSNLLTSGSRLYAAAFLDGVALDATAFDAIRADFQARGIS